MDATITDPGLLQALQALVTGPSPRQPYVLASARRPEGNGAIEPLSAFEINSAGAAIVDSVGPIRQIVTKRDAGSQRYLVIVPDTAGELGRSVQVRAEP